ncbi:OmpH/Skp family outer membrane protein [Roseimarinus sediminis]|jgi:outer membrane protein|uniref:OmpH family outer membrane protein n=1 Tax=Roseimarinus sediminis TaxID=1610899 RepID=UPI003D1C5DB5
MKKLPLIISLIALAGVLVLFVLTFTGKGDKQSINHNTSKVENSENGGLKVAYILTDSVLVNYQLSIDLNDEFVGKQTQYNEEFSKKRVDLEKQAVAFQEKLQRGGFLTEERAMKERDRILGQEQEIQQLDYELSNKLAKMEQDINLQLVDSIVNYVKEYNKNHNYDYILSNNGNIIVGAPQHNLTKAIVDGLNARYAKAKK